MSISFVTVIFHIMPKACCSSYTIYYNSSNICINLKIPWSRNYTNHQNISCRTKLYHQLSSSTNFLLNHILNTSSLWKENIIERIGTIIAINDSEKLKMSVCNLCWASKVCTGAKWPWPSQSLSWFPKHEPIRSITVLPLDWKLVHCKG